MTAESIAAQFAGTEFAQIFVTQGRAEGVTEGRTEGRTEMLAEVLRERFGQTSDVLPAARRLAWPDGAAALHAIAAAGTLSEL